MIKPSRWIPSTFRCIESVLQTIGTLVAVRSQNLAIMDLCREREVRSFRVLELHIPPFFPLRFFSFETFHVYWLVSLRDVRQIHMCYIFLDIHVLIEYFSTCNSEPLTRSLTWATHRVVILGSSHPEFFLAWSRVFGAEVVVLNHLRCVKSLLSRWTGWNPYAHNVYYIGSRTR